MNDSIGGSALSVRQLVVFCLAGETYGVDISTVREIIQMQEITAVPGTASSVKGVTNLRGSVIPVVDLGKRFGFAEAEHSKNTRIVVVNSGENPIGVIVDSVDEVLRVPADAIEPPSQMIVTSRSEYLLGIAKVSGKLVILLDTDKVLSGEDYETIDALGIQESADRADKKGGEIGTSQALTGENESSEIKEKAAVEA